MASNRMFLRPLGYGEILDEAFQLYKSNLGLMVGICATVYVPLGVIQMILQLALGSPAAGQSMGAGQIAGVGAMGLVMLVAIPFTILMNGALTKAIGDRYLQRYSSIGDSWSYVLQQAGPYIATSFLAGILVAVGVVLCVIPGIVFSFWVVFVTEVMVIEGTYGTAAIGRSRDLIAGQVGRILVMLIILWLVMVVISGVSAGISAAVIAAMGEVMGQLTNTVVSTALNLVLVPFPTIALILLYFDIRVRKEAFDLQVLHQSIGGGSAPPPPAQPPTGFPPEPPSDGGGYTPPSY